MPKRRLTSTPRRLNVFTKGMVQLYGVLAVLTVLIPELIATFTLSLNSSSQEDSLPSLSTMTLLELRKIGKELKLLGYSSENKKSLSKRIAKRLGRKTSHLKP
ncbi:Rho termination factor N-terminal domain-containing protein [Prochlorococcus sp. MIT 1300]|uniref:Rho termination factor N-terminal domain-containing protein n=1 Tax=Prochlorococcus sp. MIT 1300 TaxID=3096218 RepID=UPI002A751F66|nr:Rho termination factor N-terminal domain-containing protein [Prochlorococcus sp. MIT 1300]